MAEKLTDRVYAPASFEEIRTLLLEELELGYAIEGLTAPPLQPGTEQYLRTDGLARLGMLAFASVEQRDADQKVTEASVEGLEQIRIARGMPDSPETGSAGRVKIKVEGGGVVTLADGAVVLLSTGLRAKVKGQQLNIATDTSVPIESVDLGADSVQVSGKVKFVSPPINMQQEAGVDPANPIVGGADAENEARKRERIYNAVRNDPGGGNWAQIVETCLDASPSVQAAFVYPALGGPSSLKVCIVRAANVEDGDFSRVSDANTVTLVTAALYANHPEYADKWIVVADDAPTDVALKLHLPRSNAGWVDSVPWPQLVTADEGRVTCAQVYYEAVENRTTVRTSAATTVDPIIGNSLMWWDDVAMEFNTIKIFDAIETAGIWYLAFQGNVDGLKVGSFICPAATNAEEYSKRWREAMSLLGPGEMTADANRLPISLRRPEPGDVIAGENPYHVAVNNLTLFEVFKGLTEVTDAEWSYRSIVEPAPPAFVSGNPRVLIPRQFGVYPR